MAQGDNTISSWAFSSIPGPVLHLNDINRRGAADSGRRLTEPIRKDIAMFTFNETNYEIKLNIERLKLYEKLRGISAAAELVKCEGALPLESVETYFGAALLNVDTGLFVGRKEGIRIADELMEDVGYAAVVEMIVNSIQRDLGFLLRRA